MSSDGLVMGSLVIMDIRPRTFPAGRVGRGVGWDAVVGVESAAWVSWTSSWVA